MEDLFGLIVWIFIISSIFTKNKKKKVQQAEKRRKQAEASPWEQVLQNIPGQSGEMIRQAVESAKPAPAKPAPVQTSMSLPPLVPDMSPAVLTPLAPLAPTVHTHLEPDCDVHDAPGSLDYVPTEGVDSCHEEQFTPRATAPIMTETPGIQLKLDSDSLVQAFIMQEVLTRPCDRRPRGYAR